MEGEYRFLGYDTLVDAQGQAPVSIVGCGYNLIDGAFIRPSQAKISNPIVNMDDPEKVKYKMIPASAQELVRTEGATLTEALTSFNANLSASVKYFLFSGNVEAELTTKTVNHEESSFFRFYNRVDKFRATLQGDAYKAHLDPAFVRDLATEPVIDHLFSRYGTHMIKSVNIGGRLDVNFAYKRSSQESQLQAKAKVEAAYGNIFSATASAEIKNETKAVMSSSKMTVSAVGGDSSISMVDITKFVDNHKAWTESLRDPQFQMAQSVDKADEDTLVPIWLLCGDEQRAAAIEQRYYELLYRRYTDLRLGSLIIENQMFVAMGKTDAEARDRCPTKHTMVYKNLHKGADGDHAYLCGEVVPTRTYSPSKQRPCRALYLYQSDRELPRNARVPISDRGQVCGAIIVSDCVNKIAGGQTTLYSYLAAIPSGANGGPYFITNIDVIYGDAQLPQNWKYALRAGTTDKGNWNEGRPLEPAYIIYTGYGDRALPERPDGEGAESEDEPVAHSEPYKKEDAGTITTTSTQAVFRYTPDFDTADPKHPVGPGKTLYCNSFWIKMTGSRRLDFRDANDKIGLKKNPRGYTWHHRYGIPTPHGDYMCLMQLVDMGLHRRTCPHWGAVKEYEDKTHRKYTLTLPEDWQPSESALSAPAESALEAPELEGWPDIPDLVKGIAGYLYESNYLYFPVPQFGGYVQIDHLFNPYNTNDHWWYANIFGMPIYNELCRQLGCFPLGEDAGGNMAFWQKVGTAYSGNLFYFNEDNERLLPYSTSVSFSSPNDFVAKHMASW